MMSEVDLEKEGFVDVSPMLGAAIYLLVLRGRVVYVGQARIALLRLYSHQLALRKRGMPKAKWMSFDEIWIRPTTVDKLDDNEKHYIRRFSPKHNLRVPYVPLDIKALVASLIVRDLNVHPSVGRIERRI